MNRSSALTSALVCALLAGCDTSAEEAPLQPPYATRDSSGIEIVESARPLWGEQAAWTIGDTARVVIGEEEGDAPYLLERVTDASRLSDGRIVIAESGSAELRIYDSNGRYLMTAGRKGRGPGEFQRPEHLLRLPGDSLVVWDAGIGPVSYFAPDGRFVRREEIDRGRVMSLITMDRATEALTPLPDGSLVLHVMWRENMRQRPPEGVVYRPSIGFFRFPRDLSRMDSLGWYDGGLPQMYLDIGGRRVYEVVPFPAHARLAADIDPVRIFIGNGDVWDIHQYDETGRLTRILRRLVPPDSFPAAEFEATKKRRIEAHEESRFWSRADRQRVLDAMPRQTHYPAYTDLRLDSEGYLWIRGTKGVEVFDPEGRWLGTLNVSGKLHDIGRDYVLVQTWDSLQVERVMLFDLRR